MLDARGVPQLERAHVPVEAELHGAIDFDDRVGDLADAVGGVGPQIGEHVPQEDGGLVARRRQQHIEPLGQALDRLRHLQRSKLRPLLRTVLQRLPIERQPLLALGALLLLVEAALGFIAQPLALQHRLEEVGQLQVVALVVDIGHRVANDVPQDVEPDQVGQAKRRHLGPADRAFR